MDIARVRVRDRVTFVSLGIILIQQNCLTMANV
jgi:hypothetical protein